jgi:hypothetical protein
MGPIGNNRICYISKYFHFLKVSVIFMLFNMITHSLEALPFIRWQHSQPTDIPRIGFAG